jgi:hypothetical protein
LTGFGAQPIIEPTGNHSGLLGESTNVWSLLHVDTANVHSNVCLGGATPGASALQTVVLPVTATPPLASAGLVHLYSAPRTDAPAGAVLAIFQEAAALAVGAVTPNYLIPFVYNGVPGLLFANLTFPT